MTDNRAWQLISEGTAYRLSRTSQPVPEPGPTEVVVRVRATSLNYRDIINLRNLAGRQVDGRIPLSDGAGEIVALGSEVTEWRVGDRVAACFFREWQDGPFDMAHHKRDPGGTIDGMLADFVLLPAVGLVRIPDQLSFAEAATLPCAGVTAWTALFSRGHLQPGASVLALGTGGVSIFALQLATAAGARVIITSSSDEKLQRAKEMGAWETVNYRETPDWEKSVWQVTGKQGVDHVVEVGGPGTFDKSLSCVAAGGQIALIGVLTGFGPPGGSLFPLLAKNARIDGIYVGSRADFLAMLEFMARHQIRPVIDRTFSFEDAPLAYDYLETGQHLGKVVITLD